jgi:hypothetical protein
MLSTSVTNRADHSETLVQQVDEIQDTLDLIVTNWAGLPAHLHRAIVRQLTTDGVAEHHAETLGDTHARGVRALIGALAEVARAAKYVSDSHAVVLELANIERRRAGLPPITGVRIA